MLRGRGPSGLPIQNMGWKSNLRGKNEQNKYGRAPVDIINSKCMFLLNVNDEEKEQHI